MKFGANDSKWWNSKELKQTIRISSKMEFLKQWKEKAIASFKNRWKLVQRNGNAEIQMISKSQTSCADSNLGPRLEDSGTSKDLPTLRPRFEGRNETRNLPRRGRVRGWVELCDLSGGPLWSFHDQCVVQIEDLLLLTSTINGFTGFQ
ncbi:hypothetical protein AVEN_72687-1 [Araneus ventricosus]|uniref:Uncharacterized protein n=1 Tax=Araneus ventricosus TaxID=182803 RepID=A0A4Y2UUQ2_ARAVE|nr:hypothetical protein AVEN_72687-1 [Araneus ventricosus]